MQKETVMGFIYAVCAALCFGLCMVIPTPKCDAAVLEYQPNHFQLTQHIGYWGDDYTRLYAVLAVSPRGSDVFITLVNNNGGFLSTMKAVVGAMHRSHATVHTGVVGSASSSAMDILFSGDIITIPKGYLGIAHMSSTNKGWDQDLIPFLSFFKRFLTPQQWYQFTHDADLVIYGSTVCARPGKKLADASSYCVIDMRRR